MNKKTQAKNAMKPEAGAKPEEENKTPATEAAQDDKEAASAAKDDAPQEDTPAEEPATDEAPEASGDEEIDLNDPEQASAALKGVIDDLVSFGHPVSGALSRKPKVQESWDKLVKRARKIQSHVNKLEAQAAKKGGKK